MIKTTPMNMNGWCVARPAAFALFTMSSSPITDAPPQVQDALSIAAALESQAKALSNLSLHSQRLSRQFERTVAQLRDLQKTRIAQEKLDLNHFLDIAEMLQSKGETYNPSAGGFVFSETQINQSILRRNRERLLEEAYENAA